MNKKLNKKGFTLVELLAVIVVLAFILVLVVPTVLKSMNNAQEASFRTYAKKMVNAAMQTYESERVLTGNPLTGSKCYNIENDLGASTTGSYRGIIEASTTLGNTTYTVYITDGKYTYNAQTGASVLDDTATITDNGTALTKDSCS